MMRTFTFLLIVTCYLACSPQNTDKETDHIQGLETTLNIISEIRSDSLRMQKTDALWDSLVTNQLIPVTQDTTVLFLYRGEAESVSWNGDFNSWGNDPDFENTGTQIAGTDIWKLKQQFPAKARLDYKITIDGNNWILDPANPHQQWSGFGPNSELRMPDWKHEPLTLRDESVPQGMLSSDKIIESESLGYDLQYRVYTPAGYENFRNLPVLYVTDGQEYSDDRLGALPIVLDNLIEAQTIEPLIAVFIDPRVPGDPATNRRADEFGNNPDYLSFYVDELIPLIESEYKTATGPESRAILGTSLGGLNATYFAFNRPDIFGSAAIQSPAYWYRDNIFQIVREFDGEQPELFMSTGTIGDGTEDARMMRDIFEHKNYVFEYVEVPEGHSWGAWRAQMDDLLIWLYQ